MFQSAIAVYYGSAMQSEAMFRSTNCELVLKGIKTDYWNELTLRSKANGVFRVPLFFQHCRKMYLGDSLPWREQVNKVYDKSN